MNFAKFMNHQQAPLISYANERVSLNSPTAMPLASAFLWNPYMMLQANCRGYATAQFMQPEPAKYAHAPNLEAKTFMQPEQPYFAHHPGRFFYVKDLATGTLFSAPHEPVRSPAEVFKFHAEPDRIHWQVINNGIDITLSLSLAPDRPLELWEVTITNTDDRPRNISLTPYFPVGYMSWMNQSANFEATLNAVVCHSVTPYQKYPDYFKNKEFKDLTFLLAEHKPHSYEARQDAFEGEGGLHAPSSLSNESLGNHDALYETPTAALQYTLTLAAEQTKTFRFAFGPAKDHTEISDIRQQLFADTAKSQHTGFDHAIKQYRDYVSQAQPCLTIATPDPEFDHFVNHWLARQVFYHGDVNRLTTDPQTRNYLQDSMGMTYVQPAKARAAFIRALSQQSQDGAMPDGILLSDQAELKYINQVPHMDHCVWLPVCISAYLDETNDYALLKETVGFSDTDELASVFEHIHRAMHWLYQQRDHRGLNYIRQGDWCDPMNMVGYKGKGVSGWLTLGTAYACKLWSQICTKLDQEALASQFKSMQEACNEAVNKHIWHDEWYGRGITDDGVLFGINSDPEGQIFLNPQSWAMLSRAATPDQERSIIRAIEQRLVTPYGVEMLAPSFTKMRDDIGRVTQKHPGSAENGSVYNHAAAFYTYALYQRNQSDKAFDALRKMLPSSKAGDLQQRGQLPVFIPNYYRGAYRQFKRTAGRSSQLFNTGTVPWFYRSLIEGLFGVYGCIEGLRITPQLPSHWPSATITRHFRGAVFTITINRGDVNTTEVRVNGEHLVDGLIRNIDSGTHYSVEVTVKHA